MRNHQIWNSTGNVYNAFVYHDILYTMHFHKSFEFIYSVTGETQASVNQKEYRLKEGECLLIPPFAGHSLKVEQGNSCLVVVFSSQYAESAAELFRNGAPQDFKMRLSKDAESYLTQALINNADLQSAITVRLNKPPHLKLKACLYMIFDDFVRQNPLKKREIDGALTEQIIAYLEKHYTSDISLMTMSQSLGYSYDYLSRVFHQSFHIHFKAIVNQYRCEHAMHLLAATQKSLSDICMDSGFQSIRSFNRVFMETIGVTPSEFRRSNI